MAILARTYGRETNATIDELMISSDSHVIEPEGLWQKNLPKAFQDRAPAFGGRRRGDQPGAMEGAERVAEMTADGVSAEFLYPSHGLNVLGLRDPELEQACVRVYNDWLMEYCGYAPDRLFGLAMLTMYDIDEAIKEMERCKIAGFPGSVIWQVPPPELPFTSDHYDRFWAAAQDMDMPVALHILSGFGYNLTSTVGGAAQPPGRSPIESERRSVNHKLTQSMNSIYDIIFSGVLERFPQLKVVLVESEIGWIPFVIEQWDYYFQRHGTDRQGVMMKKLPSEYFHDQVYTTFFNDAVGSRLLSWWGVDNCMWSNDFPHGNSTWPHSRNIVARDLGELPAGDRSKILRDNVAELYHIAIPDPIA